MVTKGMGATAQFKNAFGRKHNDPKVVVLWCLLRYVEPVAEVKMCYKK